MPSIAAARTGYRSVRDKEIISRKHKELVDRALRLIALALFALLPAALPARAQTAGAQPALPGDTTLAPAAGRQESPQIALGADTYLVVWSDTRSALDGSAVRFNTTGQGPNLGTMTDIYAARLDQNGNLIDTTPIVISEAPRNQTTPVVGWNGQAWLVVWASEREAGGYYRDILAARVAPDGRVLDRHPLTIKTAETSDYYQPWAVSSDGTNWSVLWRGLAETTWTIEGGRVAPDGSLLDGGGKQLAIGSGLWNADLAFAGDEYLLVYNDDAGNGWGVYGQLLTPTLDLQGARFLVSPNAPAGSKAPRVTTDGQNFFVVWSQESFTTAQVYGARVAHDGQVLDPQGLAVSEPVYYASFTPDATFDGANYFVAYNKAVDFNSDEDIYAARVSTAGAVLDPLGILVKGGAGRQLAPSIERGAAGGARVVWTDTAAGGPEPEDVYSASVSAEGAVTNVAPVSLGAPRQAKPRTAAGGTGFLTVFRSEISGSARIVAQRLDAQGNAVDQQPLVVASGSPYFNDPAVSWNGTLFLVTWADTSANNGRGQVYAKRVLPDGTVLDLAPVSVMPGRSPDNAALGDTFLVVSSDAPTNPEIRSIYYVRVSSLGVVLDATPRVAIGNFSLLPRVTNLGARWLVVAETHPNHDRPTSAIRGNFVDAGGNAATSFSVSDGGFDKRPDAASSNEQALVTWSDRDIYGRRILADGTLLDTATGIVISNAPGDQFSPAVAWDGAQFLCAWLDHRNKLYPAQPEGDIYGARVSAAGAVLDPDGFVIANSPLAEETPEVAGANGTGLFEYAAFYDRAPYSSFRIALRRFPFDANYSLSAQPTARTTTPGGSAAYTITLNPASGFNGAVNFSVYGLPTGATATFSPASINGTGQTTLTVTTDARTLEDIYRLTVVGSSGAQQSTVVLALTVARDPMAVRYNVVDLGNLGNTRTVEARAVNEANQVAGLSSFQANSTAVHAFRWTNGVLQDLGTLGGPGSRAYGINGAGAVVGYADKTSSGQVYRPFIYANGVMQELPLLPGTGTDANGGVFAINDAGQMAGFSELEQRGGPHAVVYNNGTPTDLGTFGGLWSIARAINETGQVAGDATNSSGYVHAFLATNNVKRDLGNLLNIANVDSYGYGVNDAAQVVGGSQYRADFLVFHAFLYVDGRMLDLGTFGGTESFAYDINNAGQVVGYAALSGSNAHRAFLYEGGALINLNTLIPGDSGWTLTEAYAINEQGAVVGKGTLGGVNHAFLLTPISQPAAKPPVVSITSPANGATYTGRQNLAVTAGAASSGGQIARVDFYADGNLLGTDAVAPYEIIWGSVQPGTYALTAVATDDSGRATTSRVVQITVNAAPATISTWLLQSILPPGTALNGATMISPTEGWAVGDNGTILHFKDGLLEQQFSGTTEQLNAVAFLDANRGWAVGNVTLYTTNGGFTWQEGDTTTGSGLGTLYTLDVVDADQVWAIGNGGFVRTMDGGHIWSPVTNLPAPNLTGVHFLNAQLGWLGGSNGTLYRTTDGGAHWTLVPTNTTTHLGGVQFVSPTEGWASGNNYVIHTTDGGSTWTQQTLPAGTWLYDLKFADALHGWGVGAQENIIRTVDGGQTWTTVSGGVGSSGVYPYWSVDFADATHGVILRSDALLLTADAGTTLVPQRNGSASVVNRLFALDAQHAWAAARNAEILRTTNGGASWQPVALFANANGADVSDVDFVDESNGWATVKAGPPGFVYHSTDGGATWQNASAPATGALSGVDAVDAQTIVAVGTMKDAANASHGLVLRSTNGGTSWTTATPSATATTFNAVQFVGQTGWLVGDKGVILKSTDGGASWTPQPSTLAATVALTDVSFADANNGWAAAGQILLHTTNGGQTWSVQPYGSGFPVYAVSAVSATHAWLAGYNGLVARTTNGGTTWTPETLLTQTSFYACAFYEAETGWLGGEDSYTFNTPGRIYKRIGGVPNPLPNAPPTVALAPVAGGGGAAQAGHGSLSVANINATAAVVNYVAPADVPLSAIAADSDGQVRKVDFYNGATLIGTDNSAPYQLTWTGVPAGTYTVTAIATDNAGASAVSNVITVNVAEPRYQLTGQVTDPRGNPLGGVTVTLGGARSEVVQTDASGSYRFVNLTPAASYTVTPARTGFLFTPSSLSVNNISADTTANFVGGTQVANAGDLIISEFRFSGAQGALDEFVELYNTTAQAITVQSVDGSSGWQVAALAEGDNVIVDAITIPNGTVIPAHGHYLATNSGQDAGGLGYSLGALAAGDQSYRFDLPDASGIALFTTTNANNFTAATRLDAVGFTSADALYREGAGLQPAAGTPSTVQYSWVRKQTSGTPQDTNDNVADFQLVAMSGGLVNGVQSILGAPGPESTTSPNQRNATVKPSLIEPQQASTAPPNRVRDTTAHVCTGGSAPSNCALGTLTIRRRFTNKTGAMVTSLRFRIVDVTTLGTPNPAGTSQADLRGLDSVDVTVTTSAGNVLVKGTSIQTPPVQAQGGGLNSAYVVNLAGGALAPNASVNVQFVLGVQAGGSFRFLVNVEAGNQPPAGAQKVETLRISK